MKTISTTAIVAVMTAAIGLGAMAPAMAQDAGQIQVQRHMHQKGDGPDRQFGNDGGRRFGGPGLLGGLLNFGRDGEMIEIALVRLSHKIELTDEQKALLETFKTDALAAQADFAGVLDTIRPAAPAEGATTPERPDMAAQLDKRIALESAHVAALTAVQPSFEAFFNSLTDAQKAELVPQRGERMGMQGHQGKGPGMHRPGAPGAPAQLDAPAAPGADQADPAAVGG